MDRTYVFPIDYGNRVNEREFIRQVLRRYDKDSLVGCVLMVNNHPYYLQAFLCLNFRHRHEDFEEWLSSNHPTRRRDFRFLFGELAGAIPDRGFNVVTFCDDSFLDELMSSSGNDIFIFPDRKTMDSTFGKPTIDSTFTVFLSHSSRDKAIVDKVFSALHGSGIRAWYDRYEIQPGDSITNRVNAGLRTSTVGLLFMSRNFLDRRSGWPISEANYFFQEHMRSPDKKFIVVNLDLSIEDLPPILQDYRYIDLSEPSAIQEIVDAVVRSKHG